MQLGLPLQALQLNTFSSLFGISTSALFDHYRTAAPKLLNLCMPSGVIVYGRAQLQTLNTTFHHSAGLIRASDDHNFRDTSDKAQNMARKMSGLRYLNTGDPQVSALIDKVSKVLGKDIPILIMGETGTGKELLAKAIHNDSPRANGPFIAVNCASIPESLIESELFGYEDGAFTGARKKGATGKILQANGGTLFLDEIGDMPLSLQAHLLRVLQERMVTPLGSSKSITVNVELICATNRNLRDLIAKGQFREDLYYRLNGLVVRLPALRERTDIEVVVNKILLQSSNTTMRHSVAPEIMELFKKHAWPGNFRQLTNLLRTAVIMANDEALIDWHHLPDDFLDDVAVKHALETEIKIPVQSAMTSIANGANLEQAEIALIQQALDEHHGNVSATARALGVSRNTIYRKMPHLKH